MLTSDEFVNAVKSIRESALNLAQTKTVCRGCGKYDTVTGFVPHGITAGGVSMPLLDMDKKHGNVAHLQRLFLETFNGNQPTACSRCMRL